MLYLSAGVGEVQGALDFPSLVLAVAPPVEHMYATTCLTVVILFILSGGGQDFVLF